MLPAKRGTQSAPGAGPDTVWRIPAYRTLWVGQALSEVGTQITVVALPLTAIIWLNASVLEVSMLSAARFLPFLLLSVGAGIWVDRVSRRRLMIWTELQSAALLLLVPCLYALGVLNINVLITVTFAASTLRVVFDIAYQAFLPIIVKASHLPQANAGLAAMNAGAGLAGPGVAGLLVQAVGAPVAILADVCSFLASAVALRRIKAAESRPAAADARTSIGSELLLGFRYIFRSRFLRWLMTASAISNMAVSCLQGIYLVVALRLFGFNIATASALLAASGIGTILGSMLANRVAARLGPYGTMLVGYLMVAAGAAVIATAFGHQYLAAALIGVGYFMWGAGVGMFNVFAVSLRQQVIPGEILGRVGGSYRTVLFGMKPVGAVMGGLAAELISYRAGLIVCVALNVVAVAALSLSLSGARQELATLDK